MGFLVVAVVLLLLLVAAINIVRTPSRRSTALVTARRHGGPRATGLPVGRIVYSDAEGTARPLTARRLPLTGKPDYVVLTPDGRRVPVEIKSARLRRPRQGEPIPRREDVLQLATYLIILDDLYTPPPRYGVLRYANATFEVPYTPDLRAETLDLVAAMQALDDAGPDNTRARGGDEGPAGTPSIPLCRACAFKRVCDDAAV